MTILPLLLETTSKYVLVNTNSVQWSWSQSSDNCPWCAAKYDYVEDGNYHDMLTMNKLALLMMLTITMVTMTMMTMTTTVTTNILCAPPSRLSGLSPNTSRDTNWLPLSSTIFTPNLFTSLLFPTFEKRFDKHFVWTNLLLFVNSSKTILILEIETLLNDQRRFAHAIDGLFKLRWAQHWCGYVCFNSRVKLNRSLPLISIGSNHINVRNWMK